MATAKKNAALETARQKLQVAQKKLAQQRKEAQQKLQALKQEMKQKISEAENKGYEKGLQEATKKQDKYIIARQKAINTFIAQYDKKYRPTSSKKATVKKKQTAKARK